MPSTRPRQAVPDNDSPSTTEEEEEDDTEEVAVGYEVSLQPGCADILQLFPRVPRGLPIRTGWQSDTIVARFCHHEGDAASVDASWSLVLLELTEAELREQFEAEEERIVQQAGQEESAGPDTTRGIFSKILGAGAGGDASCLRPDRHRISFGEGNIQPGVEARAVVRLINVGKHRAKFALRVFASAPRTDPSAEVAVQFEPAGGVVRRGRDSEIAVSLRIDKPGLAVREVVAVDIEGGPRIPLLLDVVSRTPKFGVPLLKLPMVSLEGLEVPAVLVSLRDLLQTSHGLSEEGLFSRPVDPNELRRAQHRLEDGVLRDAQDPHIVAALIKAWIKSLPAPLMGGVPLDGLRDAVTPRDSFALLDSLPLHQRSTLRFLIRLLCDVLHHSATNKMSGKKLAVVLGPNMVDHESADAIRAVQLVVKVLELLLEAG